MRLRLLVGLAALLLPVAARADAPPGCIGVEEFGPWGTNCFQDEKGRFCVAQIGYRRASIMLLYSRALDKSGPPNGRIRVVATNLFLTPNKVLPMTIGHGLGPQTTQNAIIEGPQAAFGPLPFDTMVSWLADQKEEQTLAVGLPGHLVSYTFDRKDFSRVVDKFRTCFPSGGQ